MVDTGAVLNNLAVRKLRHGCHAIMRTHEVAVQTLTNFQQGFFGLVAAGLFGNPLFINAVPFRIFFQQHAPVGKNICVKEFRRILEFADFFAVVIPNELA